MLTWKNDYSIYIMQSVKIQSRPLPWVPQLWIYSENNIKHEFNASKNLLFDIHDIIHENCVSRPLFWYHNFLFSAEVISKLGSES